MVWVSFLPTTHRFSIMAFGDEVLISATIIHKHGLAQNAGNKSSWAMNGIYQWIFQVPVKGGRWHIIPQLAVYTTYIPLILPSGGLYNPYHLLWEPETTIEYTRKLTAGTQTLVDCKCVCFSKGGIFRFCILIFGRVSIRSIRFWAIYYIFPKPELRSLKF